MKIIVRSFPSVNKLFVRQLVWSGPASTKSTHSQSAQSAHQHNHHRPPPRLYQIFYTGKIPKILDFTRVNRDIFGQKLRICFTRLFWTNCQFLCNYPLKLKLTQVVLWKLKPEFAKFHRKMFRLNFEKKSEPKIILHKCHLCHL